MSQFRDQEDARLTDELDALDARGSSPTQMKDAEVPSLSSELEEARDGQALLKRLPNRSVSSAFERRVQQRVRRRTGGRYFSPTPPGFGLGLSIDAFVVLAVAIMAACWFMLQMPNAPSSVLFPDPPSAESHRPAGE